MRLILANQLLRRRHVGFDDIVPEQDGERLVPDKLPGAPDRMTKTFRLLLTYVVNVRQVRGVSDRFEQARLPFRFEVLFQFERTVEMVFNRSFVLPRDDDDILDA